MKTILAGVVGSTAYGLATPDSDVDRLAVHLGPVSDVLTFGLSRAQQTQVSHEPDRTSHEVAKYLSLALKCNPTVLELMWLKKYEVLEPEGHELVLHANAVLSAKAVRDSYGGYAMQQIERLVRRGDGSFSADTRKRKAKHARHCFRLLIQGEHLLRTGVILIELTQEQKNVIWEVSELAAQDKDETLQGQFDKYDRRLREAYDRTVLPEHPDRDRIRELLLRLRVQQVREEIL